MPILSISSWATGKIVDIAEIELDSKGSRMTGRKQTDPSKAQRCRNSQQSMGGINGSCLGLSAAKREDGAGPTLLEAGHNERILQIYQTTEAEVQN